MCNFLRPQRLLLLLDNCEHLLEASAAMCEALLRRCLFLRILATSREPLKAEGETIYAVEPLSLPTAGLARFGPELGDSDAERLFVARAVARRPDLAPTDSTASAITRICRHLDGLPLALELAAGWVTVLPLAEIVNRLEDRFRFLVQGRRPSVPRHQTLKAADWSYDLLSEPEQVLFRQLSVFAGSFDLPAAEAVCDSASVTASILEEVTSLAKLGGPPLQVG